MSKELWIEAISKFLLGVVLVGVLLFLPAFSFEYWNAWLFMGLLFIPMFIVGIFLIFKNPKLLESRLKAKEKENTQKKVILFSGIMFLLGFVLAGCNYHFNWFQLPNGFVILGSMVFMISYALYGEVLRENTYLSRTIEVQKDQKVINTGFYGIIRHPMYAVTITLFLSIPFILNCIYTLFIFLLYPVLIIKRIKNEEEVLEKDLKGYKEYKERVKYRLIPYIW